MLSNQYIRALLLDTRIGVTDVRGEGRGRPGTVIRSQGPVRQEDMCHGEGRGAAPLHGVSKERIQSGKTGSEAQHRIQ